MPTHDPTPRWSNAERVRLAQRSGGSRLSAMQLRRALRRRRDGKPEPEGGEGVPVTPDRPNNLSGGAAAVLEFDD